MAVSLCRALGFLIFLVLAFTGQAVRGDKEILPTLKRQSEAKSSAAKAKAAKVSEAKPAAAKPPSLKKKVGETFLHNKLSAKDIFEISQSAAAEGGSSSSVNQFARAGAEGRQLGNLARDLLRSLCRGAPLELFWHDIPFWDTAKDEEIIAPHPFLLPHEVIHQLVSEQGLKSFVVKAAQRAARAQLVKQCDKFGFDPDETISIGIHGDGVPYTKKESLEILSFNFLANPTGRQSSDHRRFQEVGYPEDLGVHSESDYLEFADAVPETGLQSFARWQAMDTSAKGDWAVARLPLAPAQRGLAIFEIPFFFSCLEFSTNLLEMYCKPGRASQLHEHRCRCFVAEA